MFRAFNLRAANDATYPTVAMRLSADYLELWNGAGSVHIEKNTASLLAATNAGAYPGYRDQVAAFPPATQIRFYWIWGVGPGLNVICSVQPLSSGPILPAGFDHYCYALTVMTDGAGSLLNVSARGNEVFYTDISQPPVFLVNPDRTPSNPDPAGHSLTPSTAICVATAVPGDALTFKVFIDCELATTTDNAASSDCRLQIIPGHNYALVSCFSPGQRSSLLLNANAQDYLEEFPNIDPQRQIYYQWVDIDGTANILERYLSVFIRGYRVPA